MPQEWIRTIKKLGRGYGFFLLLLAAGLLLVWAGSSESPKASPKTAETEPLTLTATDSEQLDAYAKQLEARVRSLLEAMDGVSNVHVMILLESGGERVYAENRTYTSGVLASSQPLLSGGDPIPVRETMPTVRGIAVVCGGGSDPVLQQRILSTLCSLFHLSASRVSVSG